MKGYRFHVQIFNGFLAKHLDFWDIAVPDSCRILGVLFAGTFKFMPVLPVTIRVYHLFHEGQQIHTAGDCE